MRSPSARAVTVVLPLACLGYAAVTLGRGRGWLPAAAAVLVAVLLWRRHARARFAAYVFFTAVAVRAVTRGDWPALAFAVAGVLLLQAPPARAAWPRLTPGWRRGGGERGGGGEGGGGGERRGGGVRWRR